MPVARPPVLRRQLHLKRRALADRGPNREPSTVRDHNAATDRETEPHAPGLGREERLENVRDRRFVHSVSRIGHFDAHRFARGVGCHADSTRFTVARRHRVQRIQQQVQ